MYRNLAISFLALAGTSSAIYLFVSTLPRNETSREVFRADAPNTPEEPTASSIAPPVFRSQTEPSANPVAPQNDDTFFIDTATWALSLEDPLERREVLANLLSEWIIDDPLGASGFALSIHANPLRDDLLRQVASLWSTRDPLAALSWATTLPDPELQHATTFHLGAAIGQEDPQRAINLITDFGLAESQADLMQTLVAQWARLDAPAAAHWTLRQPEGPQRDALIARMAFAWSKTEPAHAADFATKNLPAGPEQEEALISVLHQWALQDLAQALHWSDRLPRNRLRARALAELEAAATRQLAATESPTSQTR